jgi:ribosomal protein S18 acetylase RimI-like enzyme
VSQASNLGALAVYEKLGFLREEKMSKYYLNGGDAYRLKLWIDRPDYHALSDCSVDASASENAIATR